MHFGVAPHWSGFLLAIPIGMIAYTGLETISNLAEETRDPPRDVPRAYTMLAHRRLRHLPDAAGDRADGATGNQELERPLPDALGLDPAKAASRTIRCSASSRTSGSTARALSGLKIYVGVLAATILLIATNAGIIGSSRDQLRDVELPADTERLPAAASRACTRPGSR